MSTLNFDEINKLESFQEKEISRRVIPHEQYFGEMKLTESEKEERILLARKLEDKFWIILNLILVMKSFGKYDWIKIQNEFENAYLSSIEDVLNDSKSKSKNIIDSQYIKQSAKIFAQEVAESTERNIEDEYFISSQRAINMAQNESNSIGNYLQYERAKSSGKKKKRWIAMNDKFVRHTHSVINGRIKKIDDLFLVGDSMMMYPKDESFGASAKEIVNCRCSIEYLK